MGCTPPNLGGAAPDAVLAGSLVTLSGDDLLPELRAELAQGEVRHQLAITEVTPSQAHLQLPDELEPGPWSIRLVGEGWRPPTGSASVEVWHPDTELPCVKRYALRTETSRLRQSLGVDRIMPDGTVGKLRFSHDMLISISHEVNGACHALWLDTTTHGRILIADDTRDLGVRAREIAAVLDLSLHSP